TAWADLGVGSQETVKSATGFSGASAGWDYALTASMADSEGFSATNPAVAFGNDDPDKDGYHQHCLSGSLGYRWASGHRLGLTFYNSYTNGDYAAGVWGPTAYALTRQQAYTLTSKSENSANRQRVVRLGLSKPYNHDGGWESRVSTLQRSYA